MAADKPEEKAKASESEGRGSALLAQEISTLSVFAERLRIREYLELLQRPWRLAWVSFLTGLARGAGVTFGTVVVLVLITYLLSSVVNVPTIGKSLAGLIREIQRHLPTR